MFEVRIFVPWEKAEPEADLLLLVVPSEAEAAQLHVGCTYLIISIIQKSAIFIKNRVTQADPEIAMIKKLLYFVWPSQWPLIRRWI